MIASTLESIYAPISSLGSRPFLIILYINISACDVEGLEPDLQTRESTDDGGDRSTCYKTVSKLKE